MVAVNATWTASTPRNTPATSSRSALPQAYQRQARLQLRGQRITQVGLPGIGPAAGPQPVPGPDNRLGQQAPAHTAYLAKAAPNAAAPPPPRQQQGHATGAQAAAATAGWRPAAPPTLE